MDKCDERCEDLDTENYKLLIRGSKEDINIWRGSPCSQIIKTVILASRWTNRSMEKINK